MAPLAPPGYAYGCNQAEFRSSSGLLMYFFYSYYALSAK